jgi:hypothetical protein
LRDDISVSVIHDSIDVFRRIEPFVGNLSSGQKSIKLKGKIQPSGIDTQDLSSFGVCEILFSLKPLAEVHSLAL